MVNIPNIDMSQYSEISQEEINKVLDKTPTTLFSINNLERLSTINFNKLSEKEYQDTKDILSQLLEAILKEKKQ
jgi:hypothetical protein